MNNAGIWTGIIYYGNPSAQGWYEIAYGDTSEESLAFWDSDAWCNKEFGEPLSFGDPAHEGDAYRLPQEVA